MLKVLSSDLWGSFKTMGHRVCPWWLAYTFDNPIRALFHKPEKIFSPFLKEGMTIADIGCGMGYFSIGLAKIIKGNGKIIAADIQEKMLAVLEKRAKSAGVFDTIQTHLCKENEIGITEPIDFALAFWTLHEAREKEEFLKQVHTMLNSSGMLLVAEPKFHVSRSQFEREIAVAQSVGFRIKDKPTIAFSHSALLGKDEGNTKQSIA